MWGIALHGGGLKSVLMGVRNRAKLHKREQPGHQTRKVGRAEYRGQQPCPNLHSLRAQVPVRSWEIINCSISGEFSQAQVAVYIRFIKVSKSL